MKDKINRAKQVIKDNAIPIVFGTGVSVGILVGISRPNFFLKPDPRYAEMMGYRPIQDLNLTVLEIKRRLASGILLAEFIQAKGLSEEMTEFVERQTAEFTAQQ